MLFAELIQEGSRFDPNAFWTQFFTWAAVVTPVLIVQFFVWLTNRNKAKVIEDKLDAQNVKAEERTQQIKDVNRKVETVKAKVDATETVVQNIAKNTGTGPLIQ